MELIGYLGAVLMGLSLGLIGGGGSILSVPIFVYLFGIVPSLASGYSLFVVGLTALIGFFGYVQKKLVNFKVGITFAVPSFVGVFLVRRYLMPAIPKEVFSIGDFLVTKDILVMAVFAVIMVLASVSMIRPSKPASKKEMSESLRVAIIAAEGLIVGGVTGFVGAGGGFLIIPALVILAGLPMKEAVGTSLGIIAAKSLFGFLGDLGAGQNIDWQFLVQFSALAAVGILVGNKLNTRVPEAKLKVAFGYFVLIMGLFIMWQQVR